MHLDIALRAAAAGCHLFIEKPVSHTIDGLGRLRALVAQRDRAYFSTVADFANRMPGRLTLPVSGVALSSEYFMVTLRVTIGQSQAHGAALLTREVAGWPAVVWQKYL